jgi:hypothetical protein
MNNAFTQIHSGKKQIRTCVEKWSTTDEVPALPIPEVNKKKNYMH